MVESIGKVIEVYIPDKYKNGSLLDVMGRTNIGFKVKVDNKIRNIELEQNEFNANIMKDDTILIIDKDVVMLSLPSDWDYSINGLVSISKEGIKAIRNILQELQKYGYLVIKKHQNDLGQFEYEYLIYEYPHTQKGDVEKDIQINTKEQIDKDDKTKISSFFIAKEHNILTLELIAGGYIKENDIQIYYYDSLFEKLLEDNSYKKLIQIIHYIIPKVINRNFKDEKDNIINNKF